MRPLKNLLRDLARETGGISLVEFALAMPILMSLGFYGTELAYMTVVNMQVSQIAISVADNASRLGQTDSSSVSPTINETEIDSVMAGGLAQGSSINFSTNGRIILSSLEVNTSTGNQYIHWQRCRGGLSATSAYGTQDTTVSGMGPTGYPITATSDSAVMFAEVYYQYKPIFGTMFMQNTTFRREAAFLIRDDRDLNPKISDHGVTAGSSPSQSACT